MPNKFYKEQFMSQAEFEALAEEALSTFAEIDDAATQKLASGGYSTADSFASGNRLTGGQAYKNLENITQANRDAFTALKRRYK